MPKVENCLSENLLDVPQVFPDLPPSVSYVHAYTMAAVRQWWRIFARKPRRTPESAPIVPWRSRRQRADAAHKGVYRRTLSTTIRQIPARCRWRLLIGRRLRRGRLRALCDNEGADHRHDRHADECYRYRPMCAGERRSYGPTNCDDGDNCAEPLPALCIRHGRHECLAFSLEAMPLLELGHLEDALGTARYDLVELLQGLGRRKRPGPLGRLGNYRLRARLLLNLLLALQLVTVTVAF